MAKTISKLPFRKEVKAEVDKVVSSIKYANYSGFFAAFVYANIAAYFFYLIHAIYF